MECMTRSQAKESGEKFYLTGKPCKSGHIAPRYTAFGTCTECNKEQHKHWVATNKERSREIKKASEAKAFLATPELIKGKSAKRQRLFREKNQDRLRADRAVLYKANADRINQYARAWYEQNKEKCISRVLAWRAANPETANQAASKRRAAKRNAIPSWFSEFDDFVISEAFSLALSRELITGTPWDVDHLIPLQARHASGLHVAGNIAVIPRRLNIRKSNRLIFTEPGSWLGAYQ